MKKFLKVLGFILIAIVALFSLLLYIDDHPNLTKDNPSQDRIAITREQNNLLYFFAKKQVEKHFSNSEIVKVTASKLFDDYQANEIRADQLYKDKELVVTGIIDSIDKNVLNNNSLSLKTGYFLSVIAYIEKEYDYVLVHLNKGQNVSLHCKGNGLSIGMPLLEKCRPLDSWLDEQTRSLQEEQRVDINKWLKVNLHSKIDTIDKKMLSIPTDGTLGFFHFVVFLLSAPDDNNYLSYKDNLMYLEVPTEKLKVQYKESTKLLLKQLASGDFNTLTVAEFIEMIKAERENQRSQKK